MHQCNCISSPAWSQPVNQLRKALTGLPPGLPFARECRLKAADGVITGTPSYRRNTGIWRNIILRRSNKIKGSCICRLVLVGDHSRSGFGIWHVPTRRAFLLSRTVNRLLFWLPTTLCIPESFGIQCPPCSPCTSCCALLCCDVHGYTLDVYGEIAIDGIMRHLTV